MLTVDCGITAVEEVAGRARAGSTSSSPTTTGPATRCPTVRSSPRRPSRYPFPELCGTGVVYKLGQALIGDERLDGTSTSSRSRRSATSSRCSTRTARSSRPGCGASRGRRGRAFGRSCGRPGSIRPPSTRVRSAFRLAPRINAAGRLGHPRVALELLLTEDEAEADALAGELESLNRDRQAVEDRILREALRRSHRGRRRERRQRGYVLAGEEWHRGVIGIVASRLVERFNRPVVLVAGGDDVWTGSGRSDSGLRPARARSARARATSSAGAAIARRPASRSSPSGSTPSRRRSPRTRAGACRRRPRPAVRVDAVVHGAELTLDLGEELERLAPFGLGNPGVTLLAVGCELSELAAVGDGKHLRLAVTREGRGRAGSRSDEGARLDRYRRDGTYDVAFRLGANRWNGTVSPQLVVKRALRDARRVRSAAPPTRRGVEGRAETAWSDEARAVFAELGLVEGVRRGATSSSRRRFASSSLAREPLPKAA